MLKNNTKLTARLTSNRMTFFTSPILEHSSLRSSLMSFMAMGSFWDNIKWQVKVTYIYVANHASNIKWHDRVVHLYLVWGEAACISNTITTTVQSQEYTSGKLEVLGGSWRIWGASFPLPPPLDRTLHTILSYNTNEPCTTIIIDTNN